MRWIAAASLALAVAIVAPAAANDSTAEMAAGGLVLRQSRDIDLLSEDLYVSAARIRVRYVFRNRARRDVRTIVAFPMPDRDLRAEEEGDWAWPQDFQTIVDGQPVRMQVERKAFVGTIDRTALLNGLGIPVAPADGDTPTRRAIQRLPVADRQRLAQAGLIDAEAFARGEVWPVWTVRETWYWEQNFPAGRALRVEHGYTPGAGGSVTSLLTIPEFRNGAEARAMIARYCVDGAFLGALERMRTQAGTGLATITDTWLSYILTTGANWRSPIRDFRLVVDKGDARNLVSFCGQGVRRISPTQFEMRRRNWRPTQDLRVLILTPHHFDE